MRGMITQVIDYILGVTKYEKLYYTGFSVGTNIFTLMTSRRPECEWAKGNPFHGLCSIFHIQ
jgi:hypothetical protein